MIIPAFSTDFACCGHYKKCEMGKLDCYYATVSPRIQNACMAWRKYHQLLTTKNEINKIIVTESVDESKIITGDQLSLFD